MTYQEEAYTFAKYNDITYPFLALGEEAGEVLGKVAKAVRKSGSSATDVLAAAAMPNSQEELELHKALITELGDVLWQVAACCTELGVPLETVMEQNLVKLRGRKERNTIVGEGDVR